MPRRSPVDRPRPWREERQSISSPWLVPVRKFNWWLAWVSWALDRWVLLDVLDHLGRFSILIAVIFYFADSGNRLKQKHYQAWQVINTAQGKGGSGGRIEALQELNADKVPLVGVDVSSAFLQGLDLRGANLMRSDFSSADLRNGKLAGVNFEYANLNSANLREASLDGAKFEQANLENADLTGSSLERADLSGAVLDDADLSGADLKDARWAQIKGLKGANIGGVKNAPAGFVAWALAHGASEPAGPGQ